MATARTTPTECGANTDPNDASHCLTIVSSSFDPTNATLTWTTTFAKKYYFQIGDDLANWTNVESTASNALEFRGTGENLTADFSNPADPCVTGAVTRELWFGLASIPADLVAHFGGLGAPDGTLWYPSLKTPTDDADAYSSRVSGYVIPKTTSTYNFYIASRGPSAFRLYTDNTKSTLLAVCSVDDNNLNTEEDWLANASQKSAPPAALTAGTKYYFEALHVHDSGLDHLAVGWEDTGNPGVIDVIPGDCLSPSEDFTSHNVAGLLAGGAPLFGRTVALGSLSGNDFDTDGDGVSDSDELGLDGFGFDPHNNNGAGQGNDGTFLASLLSFDPLTDKEEVASSAPDNEAVELVDPPLLPGNASIVDLGSLGSQSGTSGDKIKLRISRNQGLYPVTVHYTIGGGGTGEEPAASGADYTAMESTGGSADGTLTIPAMMSYVDIDVTVNKDDVHEYPEKVECEIIPHADYDIAGGAAIAKGEIVDMPSDVNILFVGAYEEDFNSGGGSAVNGTVSGYLKGDKRMFVMRNDNFGNLSSPQNDTHFHKIVLSGPTETGGPAIPRHSQFGWHRRAPRPLSDLRLGPHQPEPRRSYPSRQPLSPGRRRLLV